LEKNVSFFQGLVSSAFQTAKREQQEKLKHAQSIQTYCSTISDLQEKNNELEESVTFFKGAAFHTFQRAEKEMQERVTQERLVQEHLEDFQARATQLQKEKDEMEKTMAMFQREAGQHEQAQRDVQRLLKENEEMAKNLAALHAEKEKESNAIANQKDTIERALECICCFTIRPKIYQCTRGHMICENCQHQLPAKICPTCRTAYSGEAIRNLFAEDMAKTLGLMQ